ncbi:type II toxin-antitoxin system RelE/ParE family toxin [Fibrobacter sp.]|uniref:type II toxin-antitoxin system RelE/ParE family toxin n=1 Tax=Fibrobacter sp. TaxID=35828 RepID=UPI0025BB028E|nr:type II toxin-antitoxin system RelE/ParE family toxin [Fibrobacter sp.]MBR3070503.1 type II toxin-antitoxin system RelE/ParE family toxin [Fibrobacter sp.]
MNYRVEFLELALLDLQAITFYITNELGMPKAAKNLAELFIREINLLQNHPYSNAQYIPTKSLEHDFRRMIVRHYSVFYWIEEDSKTVTIARILYNKRNFISML